MKIDIPNAYQIATELEIIESRLALGGSRILELGCGRAWMTRRLAEAFDPKQIVATEVDRIQHDKNLRIDDLPNVRFVFGGAESIDLPDASMDIVIMLKSLHHVPVSLMNRAMKEIARVLRPGGIAYISEPVYRGEFNEIMSLFNDEKTVRKAAFEAVKKAVDEGTFELVEQIFFNAPGSFKSFREFEERMLNVTHTEHKIDAELHARIKSAFMAHMTSGGAHFLKPSRVDLLRRPG